MDKKEYLSQLSVDFGVEIDGLISAQRELDELKNKWLLVFKGKTKKEFYEKLLPKLYNLKTKFNKELRKILDDAEVSGDEQ